jgi:hypothetical protein
LRPSVIQITDLQWGRRTGKSIQPYLVFSLQLAQERGTVSSQDILSECETIAVVPWSSGERLCHQSGRRRRRILILKRHAGGDIDHDGNARQSSSFNRETQLGQHRQYECENRQTQSDQGEPLPSSQRLSVSTVDPSDKNE